MQARVTVEIIVTVNVPDELPEQVRQLGRDNGENYVGIDWTDQQIIERIAIIRGIRGFSHDESMTAELNELVSVRVGEEDVTEYERIR